MDLLQPKNMASSSSTKMGFIFFSSMVVLLLLANSPTRSMAAITCSDVVKNLRPCLDYLRNGSGLPSSGCCLGAKALQSAAATTADRQAACNCLKSVSKNLNVKQDLAKSLPTNCGIKLPISISPTVDCSKIT